VVVVVLTLAGAAALVITGIVQAEPANVIFGVVLLIFLVWAFAGGSSGGADDFDAGDGDA
jgi:hypothetical protein